MFNFEFGLNGFDVSPKWVKGGCKMKFNDIVKIGFWGLVGYYLLKEFSQPTNDANYNKPSQTPGFNWNSSPNVPDPQPHYAPPTLDVRGIVEEAFRRTFEKPIVTSFGDYSVPSQLETQRTTAVPDPQTVERAEWLKLIRHPCVIIILGGRDKGKSALGYKGLEYLEWTGIKLFVLGFPGDAGKLLPDSIGVIDSLEEAPINSAILVDETYLGYHARRTMAKSSVEMCQTINLSRQRNQTLIYVSQEGRQIDINIISQADMIIFKEPSAFQLEYERLELKKFAIKAKNVFGTISGNKKRYSYVFAPGLEFEGLMQNSLPLFWTPQLSKVYATVGRVKPRAAKKMSLEQKIEKATELKKQGLSNRQIAKQMGVSPATIKNWLEDYPYKR